ncbi:MAG: glycosyltransferase family 2 protein [Actinomycetota bacterium]
MSHGTARPLVSIVTVCLNSEEHLEQTIASVRGQTYDNIEYIVVDGGSEDATLDILRRNEGGISRWISEPDEGIYDAMNKGLALCRGELIGMINSDDWYLPTSVEEVVKASLEHPDVDVFFGDLLVFYRDGRYMETIAGSLAGLRRDMTLNHPTCFMKRAGLDGEVFRTDLRLASDYELMLRLRRAGATFHHVARPLACYRTGGKSFDHRLRYRELYAVRREYKLISEGGYRMRMALLPLTVLIARCEERVLGMTFKGRPSKSLLAVDRRFKAWLKRMLRLE